MQLLPHSHQWLRAFERQIWQVFRSLSLSFAFDIVCLLDVCDVEVLSGFLSVITLCQCWDEDGLGQCELVKQVCDQLYGQGGVKQKFGLYSM